jgi:nucleotide-binding universal stress UspA family protein
MNGSVLVPLDGSPYGEYALPYAFSIARRANLPVHLVHVHDALRPVAAPAFALVGESDDLVYSCPEHDYLQSLRERICLDQDLTIETALIEGDVADALEQYSRDVNAALIVMTTGGRNALERFVLGSVTDQLARTSIPPLLLVHPSDQSDQERDVHLRHLLLPLEVDNDAQGLIQPALELCGLFDGECTILHVDDDSLEDDFAPRVSSVDLASYDPFADAAEPVDRSGTPFAVLAETLREEGTKVAVRTVTNAYPAAAVLEEAETGSIDWIAISSERRPRLSQLMFGSTADKIIHCARVPVLVYLPQRS